MPRGVLASLIAVYVIWSSTYLAIRVAVASVPPFLMGGARFVLAGLCLLGLARSRGIALPTRREWLGAAPVGLLLFVGGNGFVAIASRDVASGVTAVVCGTMPLWAGVMGPVFGQRASGREWIGMAIGFAGVLALAWGDALRADLGATLLLVVAPIAWAIGSLLVKKLPIAAGPAGAGSQMLIGGVLMLALGALFGERVDLASIEPGAWIAMLYLVSFGSLVGFAAYHHLLVHARPAIAMSYAFVNPAGAVVLAVLAGDQVLGPDVVVATVLVVAAVVVLLRAPRPDASAEALPAAERSST